jgi:hypothetical protein
MRLRGITLKIGRFLKLVGEMMLRPVWTISTVRVALTIFLSAALSGPPEG